MIEDLRKKLKEDVWKLINNEQIEDKNDTFFIIVVFIIPIYVLIAVIYTLIKKLKK